MTPVQESLPFDMEWRVIPGFPDYEVCENGTIRRRRADKCGRHGGKIIAPMVYSKYGHLHVKLSVGGGKRKFICVHQAVVLAFIGQPPTPKHEVAHGDGIAWHNHRSNLRWATRSENHLDKRLHGTDRAGENGTNATLTWDQVRAIRRAFSEGRTQISLAKEYGVVKSTIFFIIREWHWKERA